MKYDTKALLIVAGVVLGPVIAAALFGGIYATLGVVRIITIIYIINGILAYAAIVKYHETSAEFEAAAHKTWRLREDASSWGIKAFLLFLLLFVQTAIYSIHMFMMIIS